MELTSLRQFVEIARTGHMTKAAKALGVTQPALSAMVKKLEQELGAELLHRTGRGIELTEAGRVFLEHAADSIRRAEAGAQAVRELVGLERGSIRIGGGATATTYLLPPVVRAVRARHPGLRFYVREAGSSAVAMAVMNGELDLGIVTLPLPENFGAELAVTPLVEDELRLIVPGQGPGDRNAESGLPPRTSSAPRKGGDGNERGSGKKKERERGARQAKPLGTAVEREAAGTDSFAAMIRAGTFRWRELEGVPIVAFEAGTAVRTMIDHAAARAGVTLNVVMELRSIESIKQMVAAGIGVGFVSRFAIHGDFAVNGFVCSDGKLSRSLAIVQRKGRLLSSAASTFADMLRDQV